jgi:hypothetical protein
LIFMIRIAQPVTKKGRTIKIHPVTQMLIPQCPTGVT